MKFIVTFFLYFCVALFIAQNLLWLAAITAALFTFRASAIWLIPLAIFVDGYFGAFYHVPLFSMVACLWYGISELIKPQLIVQYGKAS
jgi:hypothetical protein